MARQAKREPKRPGRVRITVERVVLGALMSVVVFIAERRLRKAFEASPKSEDELFGESIEIG